ncbi:MAG: RsmB/NOP family class I SAM-dependent RNA methyltransferase [Sphingomonadales bacterium]|nr:RsmB/NOP family class I SAM-dependent RNA methyltransferase [Sphingomonadales bacterium]
MFPAAFIKSLQSTHPKEEVNALLEALQTPAPVSIRVNTQKTGLKPTSASAVPWCEHGYYLPERPLFAADPAFHAGHYYVQEAASMVEGSIVKGLLAALPETAIILDLCAAPGGKSTHVASVLREGDILVANEVIGTRTPILSENLCKWGAANHIVTKADASRFGNSEAHFDIVVADLPCSGEGMFRKDPAAINEWSENNVKLCAERQQRIVTDIWPAIAPGGYLIYSTCTFNTAENEDNVNKLAADLGANILQPDFLGKEAFYSLQEGMYRALPHKTMGEGFFVAVMQKTGAGSKAKSHGKQRIKATSATFAGLPQNMHAVETPQGLWGMFTPNPDAWHQLLAELPGIYAAGTPIGQVFHGKWKPDTAVALLQHGKSGEWPELILNNAEVMAFLRRESLPNTNRKEGLHRVVWNDVSMGFVNANRHQWNNLWPMEWRLRMRVSEPVRVIC